MALGDVVLEEPRGAVGPSLPRAERAVIRVFHRTGVGREIDRARCQQLVQLRDLGRVLFGRRPGTVDHRTALIHEPLARLKRLLLAEQRARELILVGHIDRAGARPQVFDDPRGPGHKLRREGHLPPCFRHHLLPGVCRVWSSATQTTTLPKARRSVSDFRASTARSSV